MKKVLIVLFVIINTISDAQTCVPNNSSVAFSGSNNITFTTDNGLVITDSITVEAWIYASSWASSPAQGTILCKHSWATNEQGYVLRAGGNGILSFTIAGDSMGLPTSWKELTSSSPQMIVNTWYHVAGTFDGDSLKIFINGIEVASKYFHGRIISPTKYPHAIGKLSDQMWSPSGGRYWKGYIDEVRVWGRALSQSEIQSKMNNHLDTATVKGLAGYWRLNENTGTYTQDLSGNNNNGTLNSSGQWSTQVPFTNGPPKPTITYNSPVLTCNITATAYQWYLYGTNNPITVNGNQQTCTATQTGAYLVMVTDAQGCTTLSDPYPVLTIGMDEITADGISITYSVEPSTVFIKAYSQAKINAMVLTDATGRVVDSKSFHAFDGSFQINKPQQGIYLLNIYSNKGKFFRKIWIGN